jgi:hypothetical protein
LFSESKDLLEVVNDNKESHFFLDEVHVSQNQVSSKVLAEISNIISKNNFLWIACQSDRLPNKTDSNLKGKVVYICLIFCNIFEEHVSKVIAGKTLTNDCLMKSSYIA